MPHICATRLNVISIHRRRDKIEAPVITTCVCGLELYDLIILTKYCAYFDVNLDALPRKTNKKSGRTFAYAMKVVKTTPVHFVGLLFRDL